MLLYIALIEVLRNARLREHQLQRLLLVRLAERAQCRLELSIQVPAR